MLGVELPLSKWGLAEEGETYREKEPLDRTGRSCGDLPSRGASGEGTVQVPQTSSVPTEIVLLFLERKFLLFCIPLRHFPLNLNDGHFK